MINYYNLLDKYSDFSKEENVREFENILMKIREENNPGCIPMLIKYLQDDSNKDDLMFEIIHIIEEFDDVAYLKNIFKSIDSLYRQSPSWAKIIHFRIFNSSACFEKYLEMVPFADKQAKQIILRIIMDIEIEPEFKEQCKKLKQVIEASMFE